MSYGGRPTELINRVLILFVSIYLIPLSLYKFSKLKYTTKQKFYQALLFIISAIAILGFLVSLRYVG